MKLTDKSKKYIEQIRSKMTVSSLSDGEIVEVALENATVRVGGKKL